MSVCVVGGCDRTSYGLGMCNLHYQRWRAHGTTELRQRSRRQKYVSVRIGNRTLEHRVICERALGRPLPEGVEVHHVDGSGRNQRGNLVLCQDRSYHRLLHRRQRVVRLGGNPNTEWWCAFCKALRPISSFWIRKSGGLVSGCKQCRAERHRLLGWAVYEERMAREVAE